ncbi:MAG: DUF2066 domain-containing protein [Pseudomonadota bacterium]
MFCLLLAAGARALPVPDLYVAEVLVASQDDSQLRQGARAALLQVLVRVSGSTAIESNERVVQALRDPGAYYYQYGFDATDRTLLIDGAETPARLLRVAFDPSSVSRLVREAGFPVWGSNRPGVLVWIAVNEGEGRRILTGNREATIAENLEVQARIRGLPLLYPLNDLEDSSVLSEAEVWGLFLDRIDTASRRYSPDVVLAGRVQRDRAGQWSGRWSYRIEERWRSFDNLAATAESLVAETVNRLANELASRYAVSSGSGRVMLRLEAIETLEDYATASRYLASLSPVIDALVVEVDGSEVLFQLRTEGEMEQLREIIALDEKMILVNPGPPVQYRWIRQ